ncbi:MAG: outer membrane lipoprotein-sorting protein [bacterium]
MLKKLFVVSILSLVVSCTAFAADLPAAAGLSLDEVIGKLQGNQQQIKDMYAETKTVIFSNMSMPGQQSKGPQKIEQRGKMWTKGEDKSKIEISSPMKQVTITNGDKMAIINSDTGQKMIQDLKKMRGQGAADPGKMSLDKAKEFFNLSLKKDGDDYIVTGVPKKKNKFLGKMEFYVDSNQWVPTKVNMYDLKGKLISQSNIKYQKVSGSWVPCSNNSVINTPMGRMDVAMEFSNIKVNSGLSDKEFKIE